MDTAAYFAIANASDERHWIASKIWKDLSESNRPVVTSNHVVAEFHALMVRSFGQRAALEAVDRLAFAASFVLRVSEDDQAAALALLRRYLDKTYTLVDAMSFVLMQRHGIRQVFTFD